MPDDPEAPPEPSAIFCWIDEPSDESSDDPPDELEDELPDEESLDESLDDAEADADELEDELPDEDSLEESLEESLDVSLDEESLESLESLDEDEAEAEAESVEPMLEASSKLGGPSKENWTPVGRLPVCPLLSITPKAVNCSTVTAVRGPHSDYCNTVMLLASC